MVIVVFVVFVVFVLFVMFALFEVQREETVGRGAHRCAISICYAAVRRLVDCSLSLIVCRYRIGSRASNRCLDVEVGAGGHLSA